MQVRYEVRGWEEEIAYKSLSLMTAASGDHATPVGVPKRGLKGTNRGGRGGGQLNSRGISLHRYYASTASCREIYLQIWMLSWMFSTPFLKAFQHLYWVHGAMHASLVSCDKGQPFSKCAEQGTLRCKCRKNLRKKRPKTTAKVPGHRVSRVNSVMGRPLLIQVPSPGQPKQSTNTTSSPLPIMAVHTRQQHCRSLKRTPEECCLPTLSCSFKVPGVVPTFLVPFVALLFHIPDCSLSLPLFTLLRQ